MADQDPRVRVMVFDMDGTLAESSAPIRPRMAELLRRLLGGVDVCVMSGGTFDQLRADLVEPLNASAEGLRRLHLMPVNGTQYHRWRDGRWHEVYSEKLPVGDVDSIGEVLIEAAKQLGLWEQERWGEVIQDRGSQVTFSALGGDAPLEARQAWDPEGTKKERIRAYAAARLPDLEVRGGGATSVDVTRQGVDKSYGVRRLIEQLGLDTEDVLFVGDRLDEYGNDHPVLSTGVRCVGVSGWEDTADFVERWVDFSEAEGLA